MLYISLSVILKMKHIAINTQQGRNKTSKYFLKYYFRFDKLDG